MKKYLVAYHVGDAVIDSSVVETDDDYVPASDDCKTLKQLICKKNHPKYISITCSPPGCGGYLNHTERDYIKPNNLRLMAVSNLSI